MEIVFMKQTYLKKAENKIKHLFHVIKPPNNKYWSLYHYSNLCIKHFTSYCEQNFIFKIL